MDQPLAADVRSFLETVGAERVPLERELAATARAHDIPTVGPVAGRFLRLFSRSLGATRVLEIGSGTGYSAYWFAQAVGPDGTVILTEYDGTTLDAARAGFAGTEYETRLRYETGDALEIVEHLDDPFDVVLIDNEKDQYPDALASVRDRVRPGGAIVADNAMTAGVIDFVDLGSILAGVDVPAASAETQGVARYLKAVTDDPALETMVLPLGEGLAVSRLTDGPPAAI